VREPTLRVRIFGMSSEVVLRSSNSFDLLPKFREDSEYFDSSDSLYTTGSSPAPHLNGTDNQTFEPIEKDKKTSRFQLVGLVPPRDLEFVKRIQESRDEIEDEKIDLSQMKGTLNGSLTSDVNLKSGTLVYSSSLRATHASLLTPIEEALDLCIIRSIQSGEHWPKEYAWFLQTMPQAVPDLIDFMFDERVLPLSREEAETLKHAYKLGEFFFKTGLAIHGATNKPAKLTLSPDDAHSLRDAYTQAYAILLKLITPPKDVEDQ